MYYGYTICTNMQLYIWNEEVQVAMATRRIGDGFYLPKLKPESPNNPRFPSQIQTGMKNQNSNSSQRDSGIPTPPPFI